MHLADWLRLRRPWGDRAPDLVGEIRAWRVWLIAPDDRDGEPALWSYYAAVCWRPGEVLRAECRRDRDQMFSSMGASHPGEAAPAKGCVCGIYGVADPTRSDIQQYLYHVGWSRLGSTVSLEGIVTVLGRVGLWGRVRVGTSGWRAEYARPLGLVLGERNRELVRAVAERYEVPTIPESEVKP